MTYEEFLKFIPAKCMYEAVYDDSDGRTILVIRMLDAYRMVNQALDAAQPAQERNFCPRCGKRTRDLTVIHTCTPPQENT